MAFVVPGVARYTINGTYQGRAAANVLHFFIDTTGSPTLRSQAVYDLCGIVINQWKADVMSVLSTAYSFQSVNYVDLDQANGTTGSRSSTSTVTLPQSGTQPGAMSTPNVAVLVTKNLSGQRGVRKGRMYLPASLESDSDSAQSNKMVGASQTSFQTKMTAFYGNTNQTTGGPFGYDAWQVVAHVLTRGPNRPDGSPGDPLTGVGIKVTSLSVQQVLATQRRRLRG